MQRVIQNRPESLFRADALNLHISVPCPLKVRLKAALETLLADYNSSHAVPLYCSTLDEGSPHSVEDAMAAASCVSQLPDVWVTNNYHTQLTHPFKQRFIDSGVYVGVTRPDWLDRLPGHFQQIARQHNLGFLAFGSWGMVQDLSVATDAPLPARWDELASAVYSGQIGLHGCSGHVSGSALLLVLRARLGQGAIRRFAGNIRHTRHFSQLIKAMDSSDASRPPFALLPSAAIREIPSRKNVAQLSLQDGPLLTPMFLFVKRDYLDAAQDLLPFFWSETFRDLLRRGDITMVDEIDWSQPWTMPDMDYLASRDFNELSAELEAEFADGLPIALTA